MVALSAPTRTRTVALVGHSGVGKTTLADALLVATGAIARLGSVEDGTATCDFEPEELRRHLSLSLAIAPYFLDGRKVNVLDTPGFTDFLSEVERAVAVADLAVIVVSAVEGVEATTERVWEIAERTQTPRLIFVNKLDREHADFEATLAALRSTFGSGIAPLELPIGEEAGFRGVADLLADEAITYDTGTPRRGAIPEEIAEVEHRIRESLVEGLVVGDDSLLQRYLDGDVPSMDELEASLADSIAAGTVFPVICGSALTGVAIDRLASLLVEITPSRPVHVAAGDAELDVERDPGGEPLARVFKTVIDPFVGRVSLLEVVSGTLRPDLVLVNSRTHHEERLHVLQMLRGKSATPVAEALAGDVVAVPKLGDAQVGDTLAPRSSPVTADLPPISPPVLSVAVHPSKLGEEDRLMTSLHRLQEEDPALAVRQDDETHQIILSVMGDTHFHVVCERLARKFGVELEEEELRIAYRETLCASAEAEGRHKKQTGGHGQFAVVRLRLEPLERGAGFRFVDEVVGGAIPRPFIASVERGIERAMHRGGVLGFPVVDLQATCTDGKYHPVDSSELSFELAAALAFDEALKNAAPVLLEPIARVEVTIPPRYQGDVLGDLNGRRGRVLASEPASEHEHRVTALVPEAELLRYALDLRALSAGHGRFRAARDHYEQAPQSVVSRVSRATAGNERGAPARV